MQQYQSKIQENSYSRQIAALGIETQLQLGQMNCLIYRLKGLGLEIAKNLILSGVRSVTIYDQAMLQINDLGLNYYAKQEQVGKVTRQDSVIRSLKELNPDVVVEIYSGQFEIAKLNDFHVVILTDEWDEALITEVNEAVRKQHHGFILAHSSGLFGSAFVDFSDQFTILDQFDEDTKQAMVVNITNDINGIVNVSSDQNYEYLKHEFKDGDFITFKEVIGMNEVNDNIFQIQVLSPYQFSIGDTSNFQQYQREGIALQVKAPIDITFQSFHSQVRDPYSGGKKIQHAMNYYKNGKPEQLHITYLAILQFVKITKGRLPELSNEKETDQVWELAQHINDNFIGKMGIKSDLDEKMVKNASRYINSQISPLASYWGGIVATEVIKFTGKYTPLSQWLHQEFFDTLPEIAVNRTLINSQYDDFIALYGVECLTQLNYLKIFAIGAGILGCEQIKMLQQMGCGIGNIGQLSVADNSNIDATDLNRSIFYSKIDIGFNKAAVACKRASEFQGAQKLKSYSVKVQKENDHIFNDDFWNEQDIVISEVNSIQSKKYINDQCYYFGKPIFEGEIFGAKSNLQLILPNASEPSEYPHEKLTPLKILSPFPFKIQHTIQWAKDLLSALFENGSLQCIKYLHNSSEYLKNLLKDIKYQQENIRQILETLKNFVEIIKNPTLEVLVAFARNLFQITFNDKIRSLLSCYPPNHKTDQGFPFWTNPRRLPSPIQFDEKDPLHQLFIQSVVNIFLLILRLPIQQNFDEIAIILPQIKVKEQFEKKVEENQSNREKEDAASIQNLIEELQYIKLSQQINLQQCVFEKDDPTNWQINFLTAASNLRARNYNITEVSTFKIKQIAGKITPALISTASLTAGVIGLEIIKYTQKKNIREMTNAFFNLAKPILLFTQPNPVKEHNDSKLDIVLLGPTQAIPSKWTVWDKIKINKQMNLGQFMNYFKVKYNVDVSTVIACERLIYCSFKPSDQQMEIFSKDLAELYLEKTKQILPDHRIFLDLQVGGEIQINGEEINADIAPVQYQYRY